jgi:hypothetical protein
VIKDRTNLDRGLFLGRIDRICEQEEEVKTGVERERLRTIKQKEGG